MSSKWKQIGFAIMTFAVYTALVNWKVALLLTVGIGFHELSHLWAAKRLGLATSGFYLVPFMGGVAFITDKYKSYGQQAFVVLMGPVGGGLLSLAAFAAWYLTGAPFLAAATYWLCFLNLFNLLPLSFMDGGQLMGTISYSLNRTVGMILNTASTIFAIIFLWQYNPILSGLVGLFGGGAVLAEINNWKNYRDGKTHLCDDNYLNPPTTLSKKEMVLTIVGWALTALVLFMVRAYLVNFDAAKLSTLIGK
jgi:Zn-dependent protease